MRFKSKEDGASQKGSSHVSPKWIFKRFHPLPGSCVASIKLLRHGCHRWNWYGRKGATIFMGWDYSLFLDLNSISPHLCRIEEVFLHYLMFSKEFPIILPQFISKALWVYFQNLGESKLQCEVHFKPHPWINIPPIIFCTARHCNTLTSAIKIHFKTSFPRIFVSRNHHFPRTGNNWLIHARQTSLWYATLVRPETYHCH